VFSSHLPDDGAICESSVRFGPLGLEDTVHTAIREPVRRLEVFTAAGRRWKWSDEDKARIVAEIVASGDSVCSVARPHGLSPQQLFGGRRQLREAAGDLSGRSTVCAGGSGCRDAGARSWPGAQVARCKATADSRARRCDAGIIEIDHDPGRSWCGYDNDCVDRPGTEGEPVIGPSGAVRVMVATKPVDFRTGMEGLAILVRGSMRSDPFSGAVYVFRAKRRIGSSWCSGTERVCVCSPRGLRMFRWPKIEDGVVRLSAAQLAACA